MKNIISALVVIVVVAIILYMSGVLSKNKNMNSGEQKQTAQTDTYVLVHGAWQDEHSWDAVRPLIEKAGNKVVTVNLPGHGADNTPIAEISLQRYVDAVVSKINEEKNPVILVGHSMGGLVVSEVAEKIPSKIKYLVYVAAYLPKNGDDLTSLSKQDAVSKIGPNLEFSQDYSTATIKKDVLVEAFCADCSQQQQEQLLKNHKGEPTKPLGEKAVLTPDNFGKVDKYYIETTKDFAVGTPLQEKMVADNGSVKKTIKMETSHLPFLARPEEFVKNLLSIAE